MMPANCQQFLLLLYTRSIGGSCCEGAIGRFSEVITNGFIVIHVAISNAPKTTVSPRGSPAIDAAVKMLALLSRALRGYNKGPIGI